MKDHRNMRSNLQNKRTIITLILITGILISTLFSLGLVIFYECFLPEDEYYFITIKNDKDLEFWSNSGNGSIENPYIIEGHYIKVPRNDFEIDDFDESEVPRFPENSIISIRDVTKSFIIQNNIFEILGGLGYDQCVISICDISVPFIIQNNEIRGSYADAISLSNINISPDYILSNTTSHEVDSNSSCVGQYTVIMNNNIYSANTYLSNCRDIAFINNQFHTLGNGYTFHAYQCANLSFIDNNCHLYRVYFRECSDILIDNNFFENDAVYSGWTMLNIQKTDYCSIVNNTFIRGGLDFDGYYPTAFLFGNLVNGKPFGFFYEKSNLIINSSNQYGQLKLVKCNSSLIIDQELLHISEALCIEKCTETTIANTNFTQCKWAGVYIIFSTNISVFDCYFEDIYGGILGKGSNGFIIERNVFKRLMCGIYLEKCTSVLYDDNFFENVDREITIWN